ncbi:DUF4133 domain-containing protein [Phocaeicola sp.]
MGEYLIYQGTGGRMEFKGLKSHYLFIFLVDLLVIFVILIVKYIAGTSQWVCIGFGVVTASSLVWLTFHLNKRKSEQRLMKLLASKKYLCFILNCCSVPRLFHSPKQEKKWRNVVTAAHRGEIFLLLIEHGCIVPKDADITVCFWMGLKDCNAARSR